MPPRTPVPRLLLVTDAARARLPLPELAAEAVAGGVDGIYVRGAWDSQEPDQGATVAAIQAMRRRIGHEVSLFVNDITVAREAGTGLHLRERDSVPGDARGSLTPGALIGRSVHSPASAAASAGVDFLLAGHVFPSASKPGKAPLGLDGLAAIIAAAPCPVLAIGGITAANAPGVFQAGAFGVAVIGAIAETSDPRTSATALRSAIDRAAIHQQESEMAQQTAATIEVVVNGKSVILPEQSTVHDFLASKKMTNAMAIVERNGIIVPRAAYDSTILARGDQLEVVHAVGGG